MSKLNEDQISNYLEALSKIEPGTEATDHALQQVRDKLISQQNMCAESNTHSSGTLLGITILKLAAAAVILISLGYVVGHITAPRPMDVEELQAALESSLRESLEPAIRRDLTEQMNRQMESVVAANFNELKEELRQQVHNDLAEFAAQTAIASRALTERRFNELIDLIEAARQRDREQVEAALMEIRRQTTKFSTGLVALAAQTDEALRTKQN